MNWKKIGIITAAVIASAVALKFAPLGYSITGIVCAIGGFIGGAYWDDRYYEIKE